MIPMKSLRLQIGELLAADDTTLAPAVSSNKIMLIKSPFTPGENLVVGELTEADFDGSAAIAGATGAQQCAIDPLTGDQIVTIKDPAGGYRWEVTGTTNLPQTIYGVALVDNTKATLLAVEAFEMPIPLTGVGEEVAFPRAIMTVVSSPIS